MHFAATIERAEKQIILARHGRRLLGLMDDTPVVPGDARPNVFEHAAQARQILNDAEEDLREWQPTVEPITYQSQGISSNLMPSEAGEGVVSADDIAPNTVKTAHDKTSEGEYLSKAIHEPVAA